MSIKINFDVNNRPMEPTFLLAHKYGNIIGQITNVTEKTITDNFNDASTASFKVTKTFDGKVCHTWDSLVDFKSVYCIELDNWFEMKINLEESSETIKTIDCRSICESELSQTKLYNFEINTELDIAREEYTTPTIVYNPEDTNASLVHRILTKAPGYTLKHVDISLARIQRTFAFNDISIIDAFNQIAEEIGCIVVYGNENVVDEDGINHPARTISLYDLKQNCNDCDYRGEFTDVCPECGSKNIKYGYGKDTTIFINRDNLTDSVTYTTDTDSVKNCFKLEAGDDLMTATIKNCNPNGSDYLWYVSDDVKKDMPVELVQKIEQYDKDYDYYCYDYTVGVLPSNVQSYNSLVDKYLVYEDSLQKIPSEIVGYSVLMNTIYEAIDFQLLLSDSLMPKIGMDDVTAQSQASLLTSANLSPVAVSNIKAVSAASADSNVLSVAKIIIDPRYRIKISSSNFNTDSKVWTGNFTLTNYSDEEDTATSQTVSVVITGDYEQYIKQKIDRALKKGDTTDYSISGIFKRDIIINGTSYGGDFVTTLRKYSLSMLRSMHDCCQGCIDVLIELGISDRSKWDGTDEDFYDKFYYNYYHRLRAIEYEMKVRENEIGVIQNYLENAEKERNAIQMKLDFQQYLGEKFWKIFCTYKREDKYYNSNFISDGLSNPELFKNALDFIEKAKEEIYKSANLQHSISSSLKNLLVIKEFQPLVKYFEVGNWLRIEIDGEIYKLRLISYTISYDDLSMIDVTFSDVVNIRTGLSDMQSIHKQMSSMSTSYNYVQKQADKGNSSYETLNDFYKKGLDATLIKFVNSADDQDVVFDRHGLLIRQHDDITDDFLPTQLKATNGTIAITNDNWETAKAAIGRFIYFDPRDRLYKEGYGVIADTLVGDLILSQEVGIYNDEMSIGLDKNGFTITTNTVGKNVFTIQKETVDAEGNKIYDRQLYINDNGDIVLGGDASISWENVTGTDNIANSDDLEELKDNITNVFKDEISILEQQSDLKAETWYQPTDPSTSWTDADKAKHDGDLWYNPETEKSYIYNASTGSWDDMKASVPQDVFDKIDGKAQIFVSQPKPPYAVGDLWFDSATSDIMTCVTSRESGNYVASDWEKRNKYTDDSELTNFIQDTYTKKVNWLENQLDGKVETFRQPTDPSTSWTDADKVKHDGDLWYNTETDETFIFNGGSWGAVASVPDELWDAVDGKAQIFTNTPVPPYHIGDLWFGGANQDIKTCLVSRPNESDVYVESDWIKYNKYTDDSSVNDFKTNLGYTFIDGLHVISPHIVGGDLKIGDVNGTYASISSDGILTAKGATITGTIYADNGRFGGELNAATGTFSGELIAATGTFSGALNAATGVFSGALKAGTININDMFTVDADGNVYAGNGTFKGTVYATNGEFTGYINATTGMVGDFIIANESDLSSHFYENTLYRIVHASDGYDYQIGLKGNSPTNNPTEAAFYIRKKHDTETSWENATLPFYVRNNGYVYAEDLTIRNALYITSEIYHADSDTINRFKAIESWGYSVSVGNISEYVQASFSPGGIYFGFGKYIPLQIYNDIDNIFNIEPDNTTKVQCTLGSSSNKWYDTFATSGHFDNLYTKVNGTWVKITGSGGGGQEISYISGDGIDFVAATGSTKISVAVGTGLRINNYNNVVPDFSEFNNRYVSISGGDVNGTLLMKNHRGYNCYDATGTGQTMVYITDNVTSGVEHNTAYFGNNQVPTIIRGKDKIQLGNNNTTVKIPYAPPSDATNYLVVDSDGNIGSRTTTTSVPNASPNTRGIMCLYENTGSWTDGTMTQAAITTELNNRITSIRTNGSTLYYTKGGTEYSCTLPSGDSGGTAPSTVTASDNVVRPPITTGTGSVQKVAYITANNTTKLNVVAQFGSSTYSTMYVALTTSDKRLKTNISSVNLDALSIINAINIRQFDWIADGKHQKVGMIADELELIDSDLVFGNGYDEDGNIDIKSINSFYLQGYEIKAIQELSKINERQSEKIQELTTTLLQLQGEISILKQKLEEIIC